ncbi:alpha-galactosidase [Kineosporia babensis]|uniref:Alpha-galactosidase n=1 Tax=Kineosporia babensis TaxID=499548 RepID=A0A9X1NHA7_9ACTN|nr:alpha-galactosidase [Kineosporia babensis]MCD5315037.1 alpha-galactosidase [Kineosporia babensis]
MLFPVTGSGTTIALDTDSDPARIPVVGWIGTWDASTGLDQSDHQGFQGLLGRRSGPLLGLNEPHRGTPTLIEQSRGAYTRPGLRGHRLAGPTGAGLAWTTAFQPQGEPNVLNQVLQLDAEDPLAELQLRTEIETLAGGAIRGRHILTNTGSTPYLLEGLEFSVPLPEDAVELLDFSGRHERERLPQRHHLTNGLWLRENRRGKTGLDSPTALIAGTPGFGFSHGRLLSMSVATSGNAVLAAQRGPETSPVLSGGELLLPGEVVLGPGERYTMPWVFVVASDQGLDDAAFALHTWQRTLPAHPDEQPVTLNVWEAVYFNHDETQLKSLAETAASIGVERFVLDDGWFHSRRSDNAGLGDWWIDPDVWPDGLKGLAEHVRGLGMEFGLWFEPEMVNPDSDLFRAHPDWILQAAGRVPLMHRDQHVLDLTVPEAFTQVRDQISAVLSSAPIDYVKWDHNRDLLEAGTTPTARAQNQAYYRLLDDLRSRHPHVAWESCGSGGGRIDLGVIEHVQRFWTSDMTDALARQEIQRWTTQIVAPEYLGAHISAPVSHQTQRAFSLDFRAATAFFLGFGLEWDLGQASAEDLADLADWVALHKRFRPLLHSGRTVRIDQPDPALLAHGVIAADRSEAVLAHVQLDEGWSNRGATLRVPDLDASAQYAVSWLGPVGEHTTSMSPPLDPAGPTGGVTVSGRMLAQVGLWVPRRRPQSTQLILLSKVDADRNQKRETSLP